MDAPLTWLPSPVFCFEVNAVTGNMRYTVTRHTHDGRTQRTHLAYAGDALLGEFAEGEAGLYAAQRACLDHALSRAR